MKQLASGKDGLYVHNAEHLYNSIFIIEDTIIINYKKLRYNYWAALVLTEVV